MSTDPTFTVEWTVPTDDDGDEWGGDAPEASTPDAATARDERDTAPTADADSLAARDTTNLPPKPVLAARVDHLRSDRAARKRQVDAVRDRYERLLDEREREIKDLRENQSAFGAIVQRIRRVF